MRKYRANDKYDFGYNSASETDSYTSEPKKKKKEEDKKKKKKEKEKENHGGKNESTDLVDRKGNHIYFYASVNTRTILKLNTYLMELEREIYSKTAYSWADLDVVTKPIILHINSCGGSLMDCLSTVDIIRLSKVDVYTVVEGKAASAATLISVMGKRRFMTKYSHLLVHQLSGGLWGKMNEIEDDMQNLERLMDVIKNIYNEYTNIPEDKLDEILKHDIWWKPEICLEYGIVDEVL